MSQAQRHDLRQPQPIQTSNPNTTTTGRTLGSPVSPLSHFSSTLIPRDYLQRGDNSSQTSRLSPRKPHPSPLHSSHVPQTPIHNLSVVSGLPHPPAQPPLSTYESDAAIGAQLYLHRAESTDLTDARHANGEGESLSQPQRVAPTIRQTLSSGPTSDTKASGLGSLGGKSSTYEQLRKAAASSTSTIPVQQSRDASLPTRLVMSTATTGFSAGTPEPRVVPRTSSIDSAISSISSHSQKSSVDAASASSSVDIANLVAAAGSPEAVILHLLKEKQQAASQNAQLWRLVDKQRTMVFGLNKDLERALADKEKYRRRLKDQLGLPSPSSTPPHNASMPMRADSEPSLSSEALQIEHASEPLTAKPQIAKSEVVENMSPNLGAPISPYASMSATPSPLHISRKDVTASLRSPLMESGSAPRSPQNLSQLLPSNSVNRPAFHHDQEGFVQSPSSNLGEADHVDTQSSSPPKQQCRAMNDDAALRSDMKLSQPSPGLAGAEKLSPPHRKPPPAPLNLRPTVQTGESLQKAIKISDSLHERNGPHNDSGSDYDDLEVDEIPHHDRGRRKTREEDDHEREVIYLREKEARSMSKKQSKGDQPADITNTTSIPSSPRAIISHLPPDTLEARLSPPGSLVSVLNTSKDSSSLDQRLISPSMSPPMLSPGLPQSPRPIDRPLGSPLPRISREAAASPPLSPRAGAGTVGLPLSPKANKTLVPIPPNTPMSLASPRPEASQATYPTQVVPVLAPGIEIDLAHSPVHQNPRICQDLVSDEYPDLLLPPNAIPSIDIRVSSSRLRPSRHSYIAPRPSEEDPVFTLSVFSRSSGSELWRVEKSVQTLPMLDANIKKLTDCQVKLPDRSLFSGHSPVKIDARRAALNDYFNDLLDTQMDEKAAVVLCDFLSSDAIEPRDDETSMLKGAENAKPLSNFTRDGKPIKEGYLTKRGKNFGGWKARFFVLQSSELKYYESPGGPHLGNIKLRHAQIGRQSATHSPSRNDDDAENQYRHAFLILEPKKRDSSTLIQHVLCAESDKERDGWVEALLAYVESSELSDKHKRRPSKEERSLSAPKSRTRARDEAKKPVKSSHSPDEEHVTTLRALSYEDTEPGEAPVKGPQQDQQRGPNSPPLYSGFPQPQDYANKNTPISGPTNGVRISNAGAWGNLPVSSVKDKKRSIWGFRARSSSDIAMQQAINNSTTSIHRNFDTRDQVKAVFGLPLIEAVEDCPPYGVESDLPAVIYRCLEYLRAKDAASEEGIFRLSGSNVVVRALKERFNKEGDVDFLAEDTYYDVHAVASLFKQYLRELPTTVLTRELHLDFLRVLDLEEKEHKIQAFNVLVHRLPRVNLSLLKALSKFLIWVVENADKNKMTVRNVGIVFSPTLNIPAPVFSMFLQEYDSIFGPLQPRISSTTLEMPSTGTLSADEIRSPRRQMFSDLPTPAYHQTTFHQEQRPERSRERSHIGNDTGLIPVHPSYEPPSYIPTPRVARQTDAGLQHSYGSLDRMASTSKSAAAKAKRRESSMLMLNMGQGKSQFAGFPHQDFSVPEEGSFGR